MHSSHRKPSDPYEVSFWTSLLGARVRFTRRGEPFYGVIVQISESGRNTIVAVDDGSFKRMDITDAERVDTVEKLFTPYRDAQ